MFSQSRETHSALGPALQAAFKLMSPTGGRVTVFQTQLPTLGAGKLQSREDPNQRSSTKVQTISLISILPFLLSSCSAPLKDFYHQHFSDRMGFPNVSSFIDLWSQNQTSWLKNYSHYYVDLCSLAFSVLLLYLHSCHRCFYYHPQHHALQLRLNTITVCFFCQPEMSFIDINDRFFLFNLNKVPRRHGKGFQKW